MSAPRSLKIWFGTQMPEGLIERLTEQAQYIPITLLINTDILYDLEKNTTGNNFLDLVDYVLLEDLATNTVPKTDIEIALLHVIITLVEIGKRQPRAYGLASDIARWLPCILKQQADSNEFKWYSDTDIVYTVNTPPETTLSVNFK